MIANSGITSDHWGHGHSVVFLHGLLGSRVNWRQAAIQLSNDHATWTLDLPGHGDSAAPESFDQQVLAEAVVSWHKQQAISASMWVGHSLGAKIVMRIARSYPELCAGLVLVDLSPGRAKPRHAGLLRAMKTLDFSKINQRSSIKINLINAGIDEPTASFVAMNARYNDDGSWSWKCDVVKLERDYSLICDAVPSDFIFDGPVSVVKGHLSDYLNESDKVTYQSMFPHMEWIDVEGAGHLVQWDQPVAMQNILNATASRVWNV